MPPNLQSPTSLTTERYIFYIKILENDLQKDQHIITLWINQTIWFIKNFVSKILLKR